MKIIIMAWVFFSFGAHTSEVLPLPDENGPVIVPAPIFQPPNELNVKLITAAQNGQLNLVKQYLAEGAQINAVEDWTALMAAAFNNHLEVGEFLIEAGADVNIAQEESVASERQSTMALHYAQTAVFAQMLLENGALLEQKEWRGRTPFLLAIERNNYELTKFYLEKGADLFASNDGVHALSLVSSEKIAQLLLEYGFPIDQKNTDHYGLTALLQACSVKNLGMVKFLLENGADIFALSEYGASCLHYAANPYSGRYQSVAANDMDIGLPIVMLLLEYGALPLNENAQPTPLHWTLGLKIADTLIANGFSINAKNAEGRTPLHKSVQIPGRGCGRYYFPSDNSYLEMSAHLLYNGANVNARDKEGKTPLHLVSTRAFYPDLLELLLKNDGDLEALDNDNFTPLFSAASVLNVATVEFLIQKGAIVTEDMIEAVESGDHCHQHQECIDRKNQVLEILRASIT